MRPGKRDINIFKLIVGAVFLLLVCYSFTVLPYINTDDNSDLMISPLDTGHINGVGYKFIQKDTFYSFTGSFFIDANIECVKDVSFNVEHKQQYTADAKSISLLKRGEGWCILRYVYQKFRYFENSSDWMIKLGEDRIDYKMIYNKSNVDIADVLLTSEGYYAFTKEATGYRVEYYQECYLKPGFLTKRYLSIAKDDAIRLMVDYHAYLQRTCK
jgi:hypothetical protein